MLRLHSEFPAISRGSDGHLPYSSKSTPINKDKRSLTALCTIGTVKSRVLYSVLAQRAQSRIE